jgi:hypothetical protein
MSLTAAERARLAALADVLIPAGDGFPAASQAGVAAEGIDQVLAVRPDLEEPLRTLLAAAERPAAEAVAGLKAARPDLFGALAEAVPGAYFLNPEVRRRLGYGGQSPRPIDPRPDYLDDGLLQSVIDRGPIYRPTPPPAGGSPPPPTRAG